MSNLFYIYCIYNKATGKSYIGQRKCPDNKTPETDTYMGSGKILKRSIAKYGKDNFEKYIKETCSTREEADFLEKRWIRFYRLGGYAEYNIADGGYSNAGPHYGSHNPAVWNEEQRKKQSDRKKEAIRTGKEKAFGHGMNCSFFGNSNGFYGKHHTEETKKKLSEINKNRKRPHPKRDAANKLKEEKKLARELRHKEYIEKKQKEKELHSLHHYWFWNSETLQETYLPYKPEGESWNKGRLPYEYWSDERKESYRQKHGGKANYTEETMKSKKEKAVKSAKDRVYYTNGIEDRHLMQGEDIPEDFYPGTCHHGNGGRYKGKHWIINDRGKREWQK